MDARKFDHDEPIGDHLERWQFSQSAGAALRHQSQQERAPRLRFLIRSAMREAAYAYDAIGVGCAVLQEWKGGWIGGLYAHGSFKYREADIFAGVVRDDTEWRVELSLTNRLLTFRGFAPRLTLGAVDRDSNIGLYAFDRRYVRIGVTREF
ncbi:MAG: DUF560 domain-containing protein [Burkholderiales bacterium]|nr:DUF560 domain-containing protein [Burkholderiales bacterium]